MSIYIGTRQKDKKEEEFLSAALNTMELNGEQVKYYSTRKLFDFGFIFPKGSVLSLRMAVRTIALCLIATFLMFWPCPSTPKLGWQFCFPVLSSSDGLIFASLVSFLLSLFQSLTFSRWWTTREKLSAVMYNISYASTCISIYTNKGDEHIENLKRNALRWLNLVHALIYKQAVKDTDLTDLEDLITKDETEALMSSPNMAGTVVTWIIASWRELALRGAVKPDAMFIHLQTYMGNILSAIQDIFAFLETQMPYSYLHLLTLITKIHLAFVVFYGAGIISNGVVAESWGRIIFGYAVIFTNNIIYEGLLSIHDMLVNPLGNDIGDFPSKLYRHTTELFTRSVSKGPAIDILV